MRRLAVYASVINVVIVSVLLLRNHGCGFIECTMRTTVERDEDTDLSRGDRDINNCYDNAVKIPKPEPDTDASRRYNCQPPQFSQLPLTATALASSPGSGSTWLRYLLQQATGRSWWERNTTLGPVVVEVFLVSVRLIQIYQ